MLRTSKSRRSAGARGISGGHIRKRDDRLALRERRHRPFRKSNNAASPAAARLPFKMSRRVWLMPDGSPSYGGISGQDGSTSGLVPHRAAQPRVSLAPRFEAPRNRVEDPGFARGLFADGGLAEETGGPAPRTSGVVTPAHLILEES